MDRTVLLLVDPDDQAALDVSGLTLDGFERVVVRVVDYDCLDRNAETIAREAREMGVDLVLFSRNDQVFSRRSIGPMIRRLRSGYSSFSGIDQGEAHSQARQAVADLRAGRGALALASHLPAGDAISPRPRGTFSLIFDVEQLGGARFGVPRILEVLERHAVRATFFVTGFIDRLYPDLLPALVARGHEIGIHGMYHDWLAGLPLDEQRKRLQEHLADFRKRYPVVGANLIYRMDANTVRALVETGLRYYTVFAHHYYRPFAYRRPSLRPLPMRTRGGMIWMVAVPVETYALPWFATRLLIDSALIRTREESAGHVSVLMHPFRDGSLRHLGQLEAMLHHLLSVRHLRPITLDKLTAARPSAQASAQIITSVERIDASYPEGYQRRLWARSELYFERIATLFRALTALGRQPALTVEVDGAGDAYAVYPEVPVEGAKAIYSDPLAGCRENSRGWRQLLDLLRDTRGLNAFLPPDRAQQWALLVDLGLPRHAQDIVGFLPEAVVRLAYRLRKGRLLF